MKLHTRLISLLLVLITAATSLVACGDKKPNYRDDNDDAPLQLYQTEYAMTPDSTTSSDSTKESNQEIINDPNSIVLFQNGNYTAKFIVSDKATTEEKAVCSTLCNAIKEKTNRYAISTTDYLASGKTYDPQELAVLIGKTNHNESKQALADTPYGSYSIKIIGNKVVLSFYSKDDGVELVELLTKAIQVDSAGCVSIPRSFSAFKQGTPQLEGLPKYASSATKVVDCNDDTNMIAVSETSLDAFKEYCSVLEQNGFTPYTSRDDVNGNYFRTYTKGSNAVTAYFMPSSKSARIIMGPIDDIPTKEKDNSPELTTPSLTLLSQGSNNNNGLGMIYLLPNGKFIIIDGGFSTYYEIYDKLQNLAPDPDEIVIAAWYVTHAHGDHQNALVSFLKRYSSTRVTIESILYNYTTIEQYKAITETGPDGVDEHNTFTSAISRYASKNTKIIKPHTGQIYEYGSSSVEILYTVEDYLPKTLNYLNTSSLVIRVKVGEHSMLALADTTHVSGDILKNTYGSYLQSEAVQLAHHGTYPGYSTLYNAIQAKLLIWPSNLSNAQIRINEDTAVVTAVSHATDVIVCNIRDVTLPIPYTYQNNKQDFFNSINYH